MYFFSVCEMKCSFLRTCALSTIFVRNLWRNVMHILMDYCLYFQHFNIFLPQHICITSYFELYLGVKNILVSAILKLKFLAIQSWEKDALLSWFNSCWLHCYIGGEFNSTCMLHLSDLKINLFICWAWYSPRSQTNFNSSQPLMATPNISRLILGVAKIIHNTCIDVFR